jgi:hypothetical protein
LSRQKSRSMRPWNKECAAGTRADIRQPCRPDPWLPDSAKGYYHSPPSGRESERVAGFTALGASADVAEPKRGGLGQGGGGLGQGVCAVSRRSSSCRGNKFGCPDRGAVRTGGGDPARPAVDVRIVGNRGGAARVVSLVVTAAGEAYHRHPHPRAGDPAARRDPRGGYTGSANLLVRYLNQGRAHDQRAAPPPNWMAG